MRIVDADAVAAALEPGRLIAALDRMLVAGACAPARHHHELPAADSPTATLLLMPAWTPDGYLGVKIATIFPGNADRGVPSVGALYALFSARDGRLLAVLDGAEITARRTGATAALAARDLARPDARRLLVVGTGRVARELVRHHVALRPHLEVEIWGRAPAHAASLISQLAAEGVAARSAARLDEALTAADIVAAATLASSPLIESRHVRAGTHVQLIGSFTPTMREADDALFSRARVCVDSMTALTESGDLLSPLRAGVLAPEGVVTLAEVCAGRAAGWQPADDVTVYKSVGFALEDLAAAALVYETAFASRGP